MVLLNRSMFNSSNLARGKGFGEVVTVLQGLDLEASRLLAGECSLGLFNFAFQLAEGPEVLASIGTGLLLVLLDKVVLGYRR